MLLKKVRFNWAILIQFIDHSVIENRLVVMAGKCELFKSPRKYDSIAFILFVKLANPSAKNTILICRQFFISENWMQLKWMHNTHYYCFTNCFKLQLHMSLCSLLLLYQSVCICSKFSLQSQTKNFIILCLFKQFLSALSLLHAPLLCSQF